jgi:hypothetical protein
MSVPASSASVAGTNVLALLLAKTKVAGAEEARAAAAAAKAKHKAEAEAARAKKQSKAPARLILSTAGKTCASWSDGDDKFLQELVSTPNDGLQLLKGGSIWDVREKSWNGVMSPKRTGNALRQRWGFLKRSGWKVLEVPPVKTATRWDTADDDCLRKLVAAGGEKDWDKKAAALNAVRSTGMHSNRSASSVRNRWKWIKTQENAEAAAREAKAAEVRAKEAARVMEAEIRYKAAVREHGTMQRVMSAITKEITSLGCGHVQFHGGPEQEEVVSEMQTLIGAVDSVDRLWIALRKSETRSDVQVALVNDRCVLLSAEAKELKRRISAVFHTVVSEPEKPVELPQPKSKQPRNNGMQAAIGRHVANAYIDQEDPQAQSPYTPGARPRSANEEIVRLVNAALVEEGLPPTYQWDNLINWMKNTSYKNTLVDQGRLPPSWARKTEGSENAYLSGGGDIISPTGQRTSPGPRKRKERSLEHTKKYNIDRLRNLAAMQDRNMANPLGKDQSADYEDGELDVSKRMAKGRGPKVPAPLPPGPPPPLRPTVGGHSAAHSGLHNPRKKARKHEEDEDEGHSPNSSKYKRNNNGDGYKLARNVLNNYIASEYPQLPDPYRQNAR